MNAMITRKIWSMALFAGAAIVAPVVVAACDSSTGVHEVVPGTDSGNPNTDSGGGGTDGGSDGAGNDGAPGDDCVTNPTTHDEIINACTDAAKFDKNPTLPLLLPDGGLPPLP